MLNFENIYYLQKTLFCKLMELIIQLHNPGLCSLRVTLPDILVDSIQELENIFHLSV